MCACNPRVRTPNCGTMACISAAYKNGLAVNQARADLAEAKIAKARALLTTAGMIVLSPSQMLDLYKLAFAELDDADAQRTAKAIPEGK